MIYTETAPKPRAAGRRLPTLTLIAASIWMALVLVGGLTSINPAMAQSLKSELQNGNVGERWDGFVQARNNSAQGLVNNVNGKRKKLYEKRARELGQSPQVVGQVFAKELYDRARSGTWFLNQNGSWYQKP